MHSHDRKKILIVHAHPEKTSLTHHLAEVASRTLRDQGHEVLHSDLYAMGWKSALDAQDFPVRQHSDRLSIIAESEHAFAHGCQTSDVAEEQRKLLAADALILQFPLWWFSMPAIMKGWIDRVWAYGLAYGYRGAGNAYRYGEGGLAGKRALLSVCVGGPEVDYSPRGINGPLEQLLFPITHGSLFFPGMEVLPTFAVYGAGHLNEARLATAEDALRLRLAGLFRDKPIPFRTQNGGDYPDAHVLAEHIAPGQSGLAAHVEEVGLG
ncbi:NAD(P)H-dependent oxidoreductase [Herbaspirillum huttiense F1]|uniref:NAD(P)H-dependent oxidoreductase n=1 Tax=Herbaspirillum TaxID=963 RepID=UPI000C0A3D0E|nr:MULTISPECIES: NAD(P)H-dependent oxidoreductase [Herbaspirillum]MAF03347.1 NAD(P)H dehydrogenase [Herbaspirillum sp.]MBO17156.1 NAD(P)H dehydrogenase [Herbaspirillum sp.]MBP1313259.1 NAD(P)H dehydrogenase (quinone) [Herbaspirillum sp. 1130]MDR6738495.1 NAD(P)H dehydrogenase (quinone) [Herbaspirillum sp. 1173]MDT0356038.1 NAD(P)H-dependent oxidoreductase [Herbaspirillum huttiense F1]